MTTLAENAQNKAAEGVIERRLRPIYDAIDNGNNRKAVQEAEKVLKKHPTTVAAKALKTLALLRMGKEDDALRVIDEIESSDGPLDSSTLEAMDHCFKEHADRAVSFFETVNAKQPKNEKIMNGLFMAYVKIRAYKKQQAIAMALYKEFGKNPYYFWHVMSVVMQGVADPKLANTMFLPLAEKLMQKFVDSNNIQAEAELSLYVHVLSMQGKHLDALHMMRSSLGCRYFTAQNIWDLDLRAVELAIQAEQLDDAVDMALAQLPARPDDWRMHTALFDASIRLMVNRQNVSLVERIMELLNAMIGCEEEVDEGTDGTMDRLRGPYLARLELISRLLENDLVVRADLGEPLDLLAEYCFLFGAKQICVSDLRRYLWLLGEEQQGEFLSKVQANCGFPSRECSVDGSIQRYAANTAEVQQHLCTLQLARMLGVHRSMNAAAKSRLARECIKRFANAMHSSQQHISVVVAEQYIVIAAQLLWDLYAEQGDILVLNELVVVLEWTLKQYSASTQTKLLLAKVYGILGVGAQLTNVRNGLDIKQCLKPTLNYILFDHLDNFGLFTEAYTNYVDMANYGDQAHKEITDCLPTAYRNGAFTQVPDYESYADRLRTSLLCTGGRIQARYLGAVFTADRSGRLTDVINALLDRASPQEDGPILDAVNWGAVEDFRDFSVICSYDPQTSVESAEEEKKRTCQEMIDWLRLKQLISSCLSALAAEREYRRSARDRPSSSNANNNNNDGHQQAAGDQDRPLFRLRQLTGQLKAHYNHCRQTHVDTKPEHMSMAGPQPSLFPLYLQGSYAQIVNCLFDCAYLLAKHVTDTVDGGKVDQLFSNNKIGPAAPPGDADEGWSTTEMNGCGGGGGDAASCSSTTQPSSRCSSVSTTAFDTHSSVSTSAKSNRLRLTGDHSPDRLSVLLTGEELQAMFRRMLSCHQLLHVGTQSPPDQTTMQQQQQQRPHHQAFPHLQLTHCSWCLQTLAVAVWIVRLTAELLPNALAKTNGGKEKSSKKSKKKTTNPHATGTGAAATETAQQQQPTSVVQLSELATVVAAVPHSVDQLLGDLQLMIDTADFQSLCINDGDPVVAGAPDLAADYDNIQEAVRSSIHESYKLSIAEMRRFARRLGDAMFVWKAATA